MDENKRRFLTTSSRAGSGSGRRGERDPAVVVIRDEQFLASLRRPAVQATHSRAKDILASADFPPRSPRY